MNKIKILRKVSVLTAIVAIVIVAGMMAGCQSEMDNSEVSILPLGLYQPVRLKSGDENECKYVLWNTYCVGPNYPNSQGGPAQVKIYI
jgi:hypothetical protein